MKKFSRDPFIDGYPNLKYDCLNVQMCVTTTMGNKWYMDNGCSRHMTGERDLFLDLAPKDGGYVTFGDNAKGKVVGIGTIGQPHSTTIRNVLLVEGLKHNLLSISQFCDDGYEVIFRQRYCLVIDNFNSIIICANRQGNIYIANIEEINAKCLMIKNEDILLWHRRLGHVNLDLIRKIANKDLVIGLSKIKFNEEITCDVCY